MEKTGHWNTDPGHDRDGFLILGNGLITGIKGTKGKNNLEVIHETISVAILAFEGKYLVYEENAVDKPYFS